MNTETMDYLREIARSAVRLLTAWDEDTRNGRQPTCTLSQIADAFKRDVDRGFSRTETTR